MLIFRVQPTGLGAGEIHLKVEINCKEHFSVFSMVRVPFSAENDWLSGQCEVLTYELDELVGTKVLDLFDVYTALITDKQNLYRVMTAYDRYLRFVASHAPTYKEFVLNMDEKMHNPNSSAISLTSSVPASPSIRNLPGKRFVRILFHVL